MLHSEADGQNRTGGVGGARGSDLGAAKCARRSGDADARGARGARGDSRTAGAGVDCEVRLQLADLYRDLGEEDVVRALSAQIASSPRLRSALGIEARGDSEEALAEYEGALAEAAGGGSGGGAPLSTHEAALAHRGRRTCLLQLSRWAELRMETDQMMRERAWKARDGSHTHTHTPSLPHSCTPPPSAHPSLPVYHPIRLFWRAG